MMLVSPLGSLEVLLLNKVFNFLKSVRDSEEMENFVHKNCRKHSKILLERGRDVKYAQKTSWTKAGVCAKEDKL